MVLDKFDANYDKNILKITRLGQLNRYRFTLKILRQNFNSPIDVLDGACGYGMGSHILAQDPLVRTVTAVDIDAECIKLAKQRYPDKKTSYIVADLEERLQTQKRFDLVASIETIEHVDKPLQYLEVVREVTKKNGLLVLFTPNGENTTSSAREYRRQVEELKLLKGTLHVKEYTRTEMRDLLKQSGFDIQKEYGLFILFGYALKISGIEPDSRTDSKEDGKIQRILDRIPLLPKIFSKPYPFMVGSAKNIGYIAKRR